MLIPLRFSDIISIMFLQEVFTLFPKRLFSIFFNRFIFTFIWIILMNLLFNCYSKLEFSHILTLLKLSELAAMSPIMKQSCHFKIIFEGVFKFSCVY